MAQKIKLVLTVKKEGAEQSYYEAIEQTKKELQNEVKELQQQINDLKSRTKEVEDDLNSRVFG